MIAAATIAIAAIAFAAWAIYSVRDERDAIRLERLGLQERHHAQLVALLAHHEDQTVKLLEDWRHERVDLQREHRSDLRELLNRVQHPQLIPTHTATAVPPPPAQQASAKARSAWNRVGNVSPLAPNGVADEVGADIP